MIAPCLQSWREPVDATELGIGGQSTLSQLW